MIITLPSDTIYKGNLILINQRYPYHVDTSNYNLNLVPVKEINGKILLDKIANFYLSKLMDVISGWSDIIAISGWRSDYEQRKIFSDALNEHGIEFTEKFVAKPGHSEHQTGLAIDMGKKQSNIDFICPNFPYCGICQDFREKSHLFGFIERYPKGKEVITGIAHEPWHFRYVGLPHSYIINKLNFTLEEYIDFLKEFPYSKISYHYLTHNNIKIGISYIEAKKDTFTQFEIEDNISYTISGNNVDGFILTSWKS